ncbi:nucleoporin-domain-containing protein [Suhomyces tanzawaensis NRRL Y-17324]|uniref:Nucleoporin-domain-containing protein n=1 Tax=Suhomyces tanzawaensis NRRL Y-17324 TaxID=984487 RepID=A0A1E4SPG3_9ASCO|nr:nucleoporin-domain-containing protein [Suhomyces tanzawaensis NRRL Y-17324]ODV81420.1 nucleoporin-domain-containing protein [Suhomyces tanzawaensis NRRL Y-17324]
MDSKFITPTLKLQESIDSLQFHQDKIASSNDISFRGNLSKRFLHPLNLDTNQVNYRINVPNFSTLSPLKLGSKFITDLTKIDSMIPGDLYLGETLDKSTSGLDNYYFDYEHGIGEFSSFERINQLNLPDKFFDEYNSSECGSKLGLFPEIDRTWITVDNKLILWNYKLPQSSFNQANQFLTIDQVRNTILKVKLVKPKPGVFVKEVNYLLLVATTMNIQIFIIQYDKTLNNLEIFNPDLSISTQGLAVNNFIENPKTGDIYFSGEGDGINIWRLDYSNKSSFIKNRCDKTCLTKTGLSSVIPNKLTNSYLFNYSESSSTSAKGAQIPETLTQLEIDSDRDILYTLSNKSVIRVYKLPTVQAQQSTHTAQSHASQLHESSKLLPTQIFKSSSNLFVDVGNFKVFEKFKIINIHHISKAESNQVQLIAVTSNGCRILLKLGGPSSTFGLFNSYSTTSSFTSLRLNLVTIKFPPSREVPEVSTELDAYTTSKQHLAQLIENQQRSQLLKNTKFSKIISPGVYFCVKRTKRSDKLFIATTNYGFLKKNNKLVENAEFINYGADDNIENFTYIHDIVQLTPSMNATNTPNGYANVLASQYTKQPLRFAILTNFGIIIYQYKTSDQILKSLSESTIENFIEENGFEETCSTLLYLSCSYGHHSSNDPFKRKAQILFSTCGNNARLSEHPVNVGHQILNHNNDPTHPTVDQVVLSDRFYGTSLLISRLFRVYWNVKVFKPLTHIKVLANGQIDSSSVKDDNLLIQDLNIDKKQVEFFIGSIIVLVDFLVENGNQIQGLNAPNYSSDPNQFENEVCLRAEHIAFTSIIKSLNSMKEALSFLMVLIEENQTSFNEVFKFLSLTNQLNLLMLSFKDLLLPTKEVKNLIKDLLSSIINKNILKGGSLDLIASSLQERCGSFCSTDDVYIFKAIENLTRAKNIGSRDNDLKIKCLKNSVKLFEEAYESLTLENIQNSIDIMLELKFYSGAVDLLLKLALKAYTPNISSSINSVTPVIQNRPEEVISTRRTQLYHLIFKILTKVDLEALKITESHNQLEINEFLELRDLTYDTCFSSQDKAFHYEFYQWFIDQGISERLLGINTPYILPFLQEKSQGNLSLSDLLWLYHAKRDNFYDASSILYSLAISEFPLNLTKRIEYLSRANGFCNCVCPPNIRQKMIQLSSIIQELFDVGNLQWDILTTIQNDARISKENKEVVVNALNYKILTISDLFNDYTDPLGYYDLCLEVFKISDYKNSDDILKRWELLFERIYHEYLNSKKQDPFYIQLTNSFIAVGTKLSSNDLVFPIDELIKLIGKYLKTAEEESGHSEDIPKGVIIDMFIKSGVNYDKLYYIIKSIIEHNSFELNQEFFQELKTNEMVYLIKNWFANDKKLRELISSDAIANLDTYSIETDPITEFIKNGSL